MEDIYLIEGNQTNSSLEEVLLIENSTYCLHIQLSAYIRCYGLDEKDYLKISNLIDDYCWHEERNMFIICNPTLPLYQIPELMVLVLCVLYGCVAVCACVGNLLVVYIIMASRRMQTVTNLYIGNLAMADIILAIFCIPFQAALLQRWNLPAVLCKLCPFIQILSVNVSVWTLLGICLDRFKAIIYPLRLRQTKTKAWIIIISIWALGCILAVPWGIVHKYQQVMDEVNGGLKPFCAVEWTVDQDEIHSWQSDVFQVYCIVLSVLEYYAPILVSSICYSKMAHKLWIHKTPGQADIRRDDRINKNKKKVIKMLVVVVVVFAICWLPWQLYHVVGILYPAINRYKYINVVYIISHWLAMSNSCYNPFIYAILSEKFQREFRVRLSRIFCRSNEDDSTVPRTDSDLEQTDNSARTSRVSRHFSRIFRQQT
ncbi:RYamide receptor isoform X2 [Eurytemora carolleeae]|uniref:RYamide receptor isoform X2 n=1 Tax=Eurytemora carolleeae TaxID=1294199 RepID=UPI000C786931|nr:RYamide receptor isoform X2 [Eurytemora carolleeae]|eukprot:XP_023342182.1 RYamide receptor-like isoform X2 [Eurytemora affinis]